MTKKEFKNASRKERRKWLDSLSQRAFDRIVDDRGYSDKLIDEAYEDENYVKKRIYNNGEWDTSVVDYYIKDPNTSYSSIYFNISNS
jgi:hypothetical protein